MNLKRQLTRNRDRTIFGIPVQTSWAALMVYERVLNAQKPKWIVEIGTGSGGVSLYLATWADVNNARFETYDIKKSALIQLHSAQTVKDCFQVNPVDLSRCWLRPDLPGCLICDGGDKRRELNTFGPQLPPGSLVFGHDCGTEWKMEEIDKCLVPWEPWHSQSLGLDTKLAVFRRA